MIILLRSFSITLRGAGRRKEQRRQQIFKVEADKQHTLLSNVLVTCYGSSERVEISEYVGEPRSLAYKNIN